MNKIFGWSIAVVVIAIVIVLIAVFGSSNKEQDVIKIGVVVPLTGTLGAIGTDMKDAVVLAAEEVNLSGILGDKKIELVIEDTQCDPAKATPAVNKLVTLDGVVAIVGPTCSGESLSTAEFLNQSKVPAISASATSPELTAKGGDYWFRDVPGDGFQGKVSANYVTNKFSAKTAAMLYLKNDWGVGLRDSFNKAFTDLGGEIVLTDSFELGVQDAQAQLLKIKELNPDVMYLACFPAECVTILKQASDAGITSKIIGSDAMNDAKTLLSLGSTINGIIVTNASGGDSTFAEKYKAKFGKEAGVYTGQAYDALKLFAEAISKVGTDGEKIKDYLYTINYNGVIGNIQFDKDGEPTTVKYDIFEWKDKEFKIVDQASLQ